MAVNVRGGWKSPRRVATGTVELTIPIGGGVVSGQITIPNISTIDYVLDLRVINTDPSTHDVYTPQLCPVTGNVIGITIGGATGTTVTAEAVVYGW